MIEKDDQNQNKGSRLSNPSYQDSDNDYGLPEAEYSPIEREHKEVPVEPVAFSSSSPSSKEKKEVQPQQKSSSWPMWVALVVILLLAGVFIFFFVFDEREQEQVATKPEEGANSFIVEEQPPVVQPEEEWETPAPAEPEVKEGSVSTISSRTGRYYMIIGSFIDGDLAGDYAQKLANDGLEAKIIEPSGTRKFYRLSVKDAEGLETLTGDLDSMRQRFGENVWIVKY